MAKPNLTSVLMDLLNETRKNSAMLAEVLGHKDSKSSDKAEPAAKATDSTAEIIKVKVNTTLTAEQKAQIAQGKARVDTTKLSQQDNMLTVDIPIAPADYERVAFRTDDRDPILIPAGQNYVRTYAVSADEKNEDEVEIYLHVYKLTTEHLAIALPTVVVETNWDSLAFEKTYWAEDPHVLLKDSQTGRTAPIGERLSGELYNERTQQTKTVDINPEGEFNFEGFKGGEWFTLTINYHGKTLTGRDQYDAGIEEEP